MHKKILFISWDGPQTNYLESLFFPVFAGLQKTSNWRFEVVQFSWANRDKQDQIAQIARNHGITFTHYFISRKPHPLWGTLKTLFFGRRFLEKYIKQHQIQIIMPRSTFPAIMGKAIKRKSPKLTIIFDADGLPLEERVDFSGLNPHGKQYRFLKREETHMLKIADLVLTRTEKAKNLHLQNIGSGFTKKFFTVRNGRDPSFFDINASDRQHFRKKLSLSPNQICMVYCGSLGPQYAWETMNQVFQTLLLSRPDSKFIILTQQDAYIKIIHAGMPHQIDIIKGQYTDIPKWLNAADIAFAVREPTFSMQGVAPIKIGEYLLMGLPTIASKGIGDSENLLKGKSFIHLFDSHKREEVKNVAMWIEKQRFPKKEEIRNFALQHFTLSHSVKDYQIALDSLNFNITS
jgi:hypothetical protein